MIKLLNILNEIEISRSQELLKLILNNKEEISKHFKGYQKGFLKSKPKITKDGKVKADFIYYDPMRFVFSFNPIEGAEINFKINNKTIYWTIEDRIEGNYGDDGEWHDDPDQINEIEINPYPLEVGTQLIHVGSDDKTYIAKIVKIYRDIIDQCQIEWKLNERIVSIDTKPKDIVIRWIKVGIVKYYNK